MENFGIGDRVTNFPSFCSRVEHVPCLVMLRWFGAAARERVLEDVKALDVIGIKATPSLSLAAPARTAELIHEHTRHRLLHAVVVRFSDTGRSAPIADLNQPPLVDGANENVVKRIDRVHVRASKQKSPT